MQKQSLYLVIGIIIVAVAAVTIITLYESETQIEDVLALYRNDVQYSRVTISYPLNDTLFPPEIIPPNFHWEDANSTSDTWLITIKFQDDQGRMNFIVQESQWTPKTEDWETIKKRSIEKQASVTILGFNPRSRRKILSEGQISIKTSADPVGAPLFYREVNLPFIDAVKDPSRIRWRFGTISSPKQPPIILEGLPVCGNCHSFSADGKVFGMDVDYGFIRYHGCLRTNASRHQRYHNLERLQKTRRRTDLRTVFSGLS